MKKIPYVHELEDQILLKCQYYPKQSAESMQSLSKFQRHFFCRTRKHNPKIHKEFHGKLNSQNNLEKEH